jgi:hypothetical protein
MIITRRASLIIIAMVVSVSLVRGDAPSPFPARESKPDKELERLLNRLVGTWSIREDDGDGKIIQGEELWRQEPGGLPLIEEYHSKPPGVPINMILPRYGGMPRRSSFKGFGAPTSTTKAAPHSR